MMRVAGVVLMWMGVAASALSGQTQGADTDVTLPTHARVALTAEGRGVQIYACKAEGVAYQWELVAPEATLYGSAGEPQGKHGAGPSWTWADGSSVTGKVVQRRESSDPLNLPWLLVAATPAGTGAGGGKAGALAGVTFVRRSETHGGIAPADGCETGHAGAMVRVPYTATYTFYIAER